MAEEQRVAPPMLFLARRANSTQLLAQCTPPHSSMAAVIRATPVVSATITMYCFDFLLPITISLIEFIAPLRSAE